MVPVNYDLARKSPSKFAELLISKLKALRESEEMGEKMVNVLKGVEVSIAVNCHKRYYRVFRNRALQVVKQA